MKRKVSRKRRVSLKKNTRKILRGGMDEEVGTYMDMEARKIINDMVNLFNKICLYEYKGTNLYNDLIEKYILLVGYIPFSDERALWEWTNEAVDETFRELPCDSYIQEQVVMKIVEGVKRRASEKKSKYIQWGERQEEESGFRLSPEIRSKDPLLFLN